MAFHSLNGYQVPSFVTQEIVDKLKDFKVQPEDVIIASYPKCGSTWMQQCVRLTRNKGVQDNVKVTEAVPLLEVPRWYEGIDLDKLPTPRAFKTHFTYELMPWGQPHTTPCKYIYITRNPKDVAVSMFSHVKLMYLPGVEWDGFWEKFVSGYFGNFFEHLLGWLKHKDNDNILFLTYEDAKKDLPHTISQIAQFMGVDLSSDTVAKIADMADFKNMKNDNTANRSWDKTFDDEEGEPNFMRKGIVGDWKNYLTPDQSAQIDDIFAHRIEHTGFKFNYE